MTIFELSWPFDESYWAEETSVSGEVPALYPVALAGRGYQLDDAQPWGWESIPLLKTDQNADPGQPGESSINPAGNWRRASSSWHHGAGQTNRDNPDADPARFRSSKGVDVWTRGRLGLLHDAQQVHTVSASATVVQVVRAGDYLYFTDLNTVRRTDLSSASAVTGTPVAAVTGICSNGSKVYAAYGASGIYSISGTTATSVAATATAVVGWAKGRLLGASGNVLNDFSTGTADPITPPDLDGNFVWSAIGEGISHVYCGGNNGTAGQLFRVGVKSDGTGLDVPIRCAPDLVGEQILCIFGHAGALLIGTSKGVRLAAQQSNGDLELGPYLRVGPVRAMAADENFVWFTWSNPDGVSTGMGRLNLGELVDTLQPAYALDVVATGQGVVNGVGILNGTPAFGVAAVALYRPHPTDLVASGTLDSGEITFDLVEPKLHVGGIVHAIGEGSATLEMAVDDGAFTALPERGTSTRGSWAEWRLTVSRGTSTLAPVVRGVVLLSFPAVARSEVISPRLILASRVQLVGGVERPFSVDEAVDEIRALMASRQIVTWEQGARSELVTVEDYQWIPGQMKGWPNPGVFEGVIVPVLKIVPR